MGNTHTCPNENMLKRMNRDLYGNGQPGVLKLTTELALKVDEMEGSLDILAKNYTALVKSQQEKDLINRLEVERKDKRARLLANTAKWVAIVGGIVAIVALILEHIQTINLPG